MQFDIYLEVFGILEMFVKQDGKIPAHISRRWLAGLGVKGLALCRYGTGELASNDITRAFNLMCS